jgi:Leucine-rich repeat (LRR) protein
MKSFALQIFLIILVSTAGSLSLDTSISCTFHDDSLYTCELSIHNPDGFDLFETIQGEHLENKTDSDVSAVIMSGQNSQNIPVIICEKFRNIEDFHSYFSQVEILTEKSFANCEKLRQLFISDNFIRIIPDNVFLNNQNLEIALLDYNQIRKIENFAFNGSKLEILGIFGNKLEEFKAQSLAPLKGKPL